ncbi:UNVERIFIED_CONTAM: hypothetical protein Sradi_1582500 [Sesamum radiatum]|uniref:Uncharacterized protein n=1 Tax=Sesamum radiatum TaxID=300843 RepID=A0AAW2UB44_SESRA
MINTLAKAKYLAKRMEDAIRDNPDIPVDQLENKIIRKCNIDVSRWKVMKVNKEVIDAIRGVNAFQYQKLWDYWVTMRAKNPGSKIIPRRQEGSDPAVFNKHYNLNTLKLEFLGGCRPIIGLDCCFLKIVYQGQLFVAVRRDVNGGVVSYNWSWFISELLEDRYWRQIGGRLYQIGRRD